MKKILLVVFVFLGLQCAFCGLFVDFNSFICQPNNLSFLRVVINENPALISRLGIALQDVEKFGSAVEPDVVLCLLQSIDDMNELCNRYVRCKFSCENPRLIISVMWPYSEASQKMIDFLKNKIRPEVDRLLGLCITTDSPL